MERGKRVWKMVLFLGCVPFLVAVGFCLVTSLTEDIRSFGGYFILYSFLYWPTYLIGIALILLSLWHIRKKG